jgi:hypothetical protein
MRTEPGLGHIPSVSRTMRIPNEFLIFPALEELRCESDDLCYSERTLAYLNFLERYLTVFMAPGPGTVRGPSSLLDCNLQARCPTWKESS